MRYKVKVPPTMEVGSYSTTVSGATYRADALWDYNSCRAHDGLEPVKRMPAGTTYTAIPETVLTKTGNVRTYGPKEYREGGTRYRITAKVRHNDQCGNGHNTFSITADIDEAAGGRWRESGGGCCHEAVAKHFSELAPLIKWHLCSTDMPLHYTANPICHAGDRDCWGLQKGESQQIRNGKSGLPCWKLSGHSLKNHIDSATRPEGTATISYEPWCRIGEGKDRELDSARSSAIWPDATDEELTAPGLKERLEARLPQLMKDFRAAVESLGFTF